MNTHNVNVNTATPESPKTWVNGQGIPSVSQALVHGLPGIDGEAAWQSAMGDLRLLLKAGYAIHVANVH
ncbi:hypothetical protein PRCB_10630 [Pantoea rodasii]|uniref:Uncharacterized protein n=1 Tax=Pantoea rodasii TaxID=1076549 RepID=A0A2M9WD67_9GAMM|nr:hypothetical protein [Pantoea rodasii]ORM60203.1 hypothetical protein HA45_22030 [Pantoea rodasii]PJZ05490.1 hypothetical protein PRCB_10630 [Pantoea rodasii]